MSLSEENRKLLVQREYDKALQCFKRAKANAALGYWDIVANRLYYSIFHAVSALLIKDGHKVGTHQGAVMAFGFHYVKTGLFTSQEGRLYSQLQSLREKADYSCAYDVKNTDIEAKVPDAQIMLEIIGVLIHTFLSEK